MTDWITMLGKEWAELLANRRFLRVFGLAVLFMGLLPVLTLTHRHGHQALNAFSGLLLLLYGLFAAVIVVANTAPDLVLHERVGHTLDYLLTTRLSVRAIFGAKVITAALVGYVAALLAMGVQLAAVAAVSGQGWHWRFLADPLGRIVAFGITADLSLYVAAVGTFVALRVGEQRAAYLVTMLAVGLLIVPFATGWLPVHLSLSWVAHVAVGLGAMAVLLTVLGLQVFRRELLVLYTQE